VSHTHTLHSGPAHHTLSRRDGLNGGAQVNRLYETILQQVNFRFRVVPCVQADCIACPWDVDSYKSSDIVPLLVEVISFFLLYSPEIYGSSSNLNFQLFFKWFVEHRTKVTRVLTWETSHTEVWCGLKVEIYKAQSSSTTCYSKLKACFRRECKASSVFNDQQGNGGRCHETLAVEVLLGRSAFAVTGDGWVWLETWIC